LWPSNSQDLNPVDNQATTQERVYYTYIHSADELKFWYSFDWDTFTTAIDHWRKTPSICLCEWSHFELEQAI